MVDVGKHDQPIVPGYSRMDRAVMPAHRRSTTQPMALGCGRRRKTTNQWIGGTVVCPRQVAHNSPKPENRQCPQMERKTSVGGERLPRRPARRYGHGAGCFRRSDITPNLAPLISSLHPRGFLLFWTRRRPCCALVDAHIRPGGARNHRVGLAAMAGGNGAAR